MTSLLLAKQGHHNSLKPLATFFRKALGQTYGHFWMKAWIKRRPGGGISAS